MNEWILSVGSAAIAYIGGILTKPLQTIIDENRQRKQLKTALYAELAANYNQLWKLRDFLKNGLKGSLV